MRWPRRATDLPARVAPIQAMQAMQEYQVVLGKAAHWAALLASLGAHRRLVLLRIIAADLELDRLPVLHTARAATSSLAVEELGLGKRIAALAHVRDHAHDRGLEKEAGSETVFAVQRTRERVAVHW